MSAYEPRWRPTGPSNRWSRPTHFCHSVPVKAKRLLHRTTSIYRQMTSYLLAVPRSPAVHYPRTLRKPNLEKGHLADLASPSVSQGDGCGKNPAGTNDPQRQFISMCLTGLGASPRQYHPCTRPSGPPRSATDFFIRRLGTTRHALHFPGTAYLGLRSSPRLLHTTLRHVRRFFRPIRSYAAFQLRNDPQCRGRLTPV